MSDRERYGVPFHAIFDADGQALIESKSFVGNIGQPSRFEKRDHFTKMLRETRKNLTLAEIKRIVQALEDERI